MLSAENRIALVLGRAVMRIEVLEAEREILLAKIRELEEAEQHEEVEHDA